MLRGISGNVIRHIATELEANRQAKCTCHNLPQSFIRDAPATKKVSPGELVQYLAVMHHALSSSGYDADPISAHALC